MTITGANIYEDSEDWQRVKAFIDASTIGVPTSESFTSGATEPSPDDRDKLWLKLDAEGAKWHYWNARCGEWCQISGKPGDVLTRNRIQTTVSEDIGYYYPCGWELADGSNLLGVNLAESYLKSSVYQLQFPDPFGPISVVIVSGSSQTMYYDQAIFQENATFDPASRNIPVVDPASTFLLELQIENATGTLYINGALVWASTEATTDTKPLEIAVSNQSIDYSLVLNAGSATLYYKGSL